MILVCGLPTDPSIHAVIDSLKRQGIPYLTFYQNEAIQSELFVQLTDWNLSGILQVRDQPVDLNRIEGIFNRMVDVHDLPDFKAEGLQGRYMDQLNRMVTIHEMLNDWIEGSDCRVMNRPSHVLCSSSRVAMIQAARRVGFRIPPVLITNDEPEARSFIEATSVHLVSLSVSSTHQDAEWIKLGKSVETRQELSLPRLLQQIPDGICGRVMIAGDRILSCVYPKPGDIWSREGFLPGRGPSLEWSLPESVVQRCLDLSRTIDLPCCGIDLACPENGEIYFLQVEASPDLSAYTDREGFNRAAEGVTHSLVGSNLD